MRGLERAACRIRASSEAVTGKAERTDVISCRTGLQDYSCHMAQSRDPSPEALLENRPARGQQYAVHGDRDADRTSQAQPAPRSAQVERSVGSQGEFLFDATVRNSESWLSCSLPAFGNCQPRARICDESQLDTTLNFARPRHCAGSTGCGLISSASRVLRAIGT